MNWIELAGLPEQRLPMHLNKQKSFWEIKDGKIVHQGRVNRLAEVESFEILEGTDFIARDKAFIYHAWTTLKSIDRDSFKALGNGYYCDKDCGYYDFESTMRPLKGHTAEKLKVLNAGYARDIRFAYYCGHAIGKCTSPLTFQPVEQKGEHPVPAARDDKYCYYEGAYLKGADVQSWIMGEKGFSKDAKRVYFGSKKLAGARAAEWKVLKHPYSTAGKKAYYMGLTIPDVDIDSLEVLSDGTVRDKISKFSGKNRV